MTDLEMYKFNTVSLKDWEHAVDEKASERAKKMRHKKLAFKALKEVEAFWFPKKLPSWFSEKECSTECSMGETYCVWKIRPFGKAGYFLVYIEEAKIWIIDVDRLGDKSYPCGKPDWGLTTNLAA